MSSHFYIYIIWMACLLPRPFFHVFKTHHLPCWYLGSSKQKSLQNHNKSGIKNILICKYYLLLAHHQKDKKIARSQSFTTRCKASLNIPLRIIRCKFIRSYIRKGHNGHLISVDRYILQNVVDAIFNTIYSFYISSNTIRFIYLQSHIWYFYDCLNF